MRINLANQITLGRLFLAIIFIALLSWYDADKPDSHRWILEVSFWIFLVAAIGDVLDGLVARMTNSVTSFGRIVDPVVDKIMICGAFVLFAGSPFVAGDHNISGVAPWMAVVILAREILVSAVRSHAEGAGQEFGAAWFGKLKMFLQSFTVCMILATLAWNVFPGEDSVRPICVWLTVIVTAASGASYVRQARAFLLTATALAGAQPESDQEKEQQ